MLCQLDVAMSVLKYWIHELRGEIGAGNETRTRDPDLGKVVLYQLSYSRIGIIICSSLLIRIGAGNETRTRDPDLGKVVLYQLSYSRVVMGAILAISKTASTP